jgi:hypothetical protein
MNISQAREVQKVTKNIASRGAASNAFRQLMNLPVKSASTVTGVGENVLNVIGRTFTDLRRTLFLSSSD